MSDRDYDTVQIQIDTLLEDACYAHSAGQETVAVLLSGGVDSLSVAFALDKLGKNVCAYSFRLDRHDNYDNETAKRTCEIFGWHHEECWVDTKNLEDDWKKLAIQYKCKKKTHFECVFPFMYVYPFITESHVFTGWGADGYYGVSKKAMMHFKEPKEKFDEFRKDYHHPDRTAGLKWHNRIAMAYNKEHCYPYMDEDIMDWFYSKDWYELNQPQQKHHVRTAYKEQFDKVGRVLPHRNLQLESGVDKVFEELLDNKNINYKGRDRIMDVCRDWGYVPTITLESLF